MAVAVAVAVGACVGVAMGGTAIGVGVKVAVGSGVRVGVGGGGVGTGVAVAVGASSLAQMAVSTRSLSMVTATNCDKALVETPSGTSPAHNTKPKLQLTTRTTTVPLA